MISQNLHILYLVTAIALLTTEAFIVSPIASHTPSRSNSNSNNGMIQIQSVRESSPTATYSRSILREGGGANSDTATDEIILSPPEQKVYNVLQDLHNAQFPFRLVVVGNGAISETTANLGPTFKLGTSPRTGEPIATFASVDQSFEFHLMISQVSKIVMTSKATSGGEKDDQLMQIFRFLTDDGKSMCSLILADKGDEAQAWFQTMLDKYNQGDIQL